MIDLTEMLYFQIKKVKQQNVVGFRVDFETHELEF